MNVEVLDEAEVELNEAITYYQEVEPGLGLRLKEEVRSIIQWIGLNPNVPRIRPNGYRRVNLHIFPYYVAYTIAVDTVWILAIAHSHRRPDYWLSRHAPH